MESKKETKKNEKKAVSKPSKKGEFNDPHCPFHGKLSVRGRAFTEKIVKAKSNRTATIEIERRQYMPKYERYEKKKTRIHVHNPECISAKPGDVVKVQECRPISKTKHFVIVKKIK